ncbi:hypothetical protein SY83_09225 [Paenibacillus swuensis]|uniref:ABC transporter substrate-binding protein n=2 Tax=Paenibacillus swuensis TaxID=1178515 RepID=A0A172TP41_9BACL|nr:hypothetical protein SY83_09225 [Paenibacillus swuensis]
MLAMTACGTSENASNNTNAEKTQNNTTVTAKSDKPYWLTDEKVTLKVVVPQDPAIIDFATNNFTKWMEEQTNVHLEFQYVPTDKKKESLNLLLASGEFPDIFLGLDVPDDMEATYGVSQKVFLPLNELIEKHMPNFTQVMQDYPRIKGQITATDGNIYALPSVNECYHCTYQQRYWLNMDWLKTLNLKEPTTTEELYQVLKAFKEKDPNGNGKQDEIPLVGAYEGGWNANVDPWLMSAFIMDPGMYNKTKLALKGEQVTSTANEPEYKEGLAYIHKLYNEGLIYEASFTQKQDQMKQMLASEPTIVGSFTSGASVIDVDPNTNEKTYRQFDMLAPVAGPSGTASTPKFEYDLAQPGEFLISASSKHAEIAAKWADLFYGKNFDVQLRRHKGSEGEGWRKAEAGEKGLDGRDAIFTPLKAYNTEAQNDTWISVGIEYYPADYRLAENVPQEEDIMAPKASEKLLYVHTKDKYEPKASQSIKVMPPTKLLAEENQELSTVRVELEKYIEEFRVRSITEEGYLDNNWESYRSNLDKLGLTRFLEIYQTAYERQYKQ